MLMSTCPMIFLLRLQKMILIESILAGSSHVPMENFVDSEFKIGGLHEMKWVFVVSVRLCSFQVDKN